MSTLKVRSTVARYVLQTGQKKTLGFMLPGEYKFNTAAKEHLEIIVGDLDVLLPGNSSWQTVKGGESFDVPESSQFKVNVKTPCDYCCSFIK